MMFIFITDTMFFISLVSNLHEEKLESRTIGFKALNFGKFYV